ncbi:hypothetical protein ACGO3R_03115 [Lactococcus lactis]
MELYLFDEANSALDVHSEKQLYQKLMELSAGATVIWITHRMTSVKLSDKVIYLDKGKVLGFDSHENLLKMKTMRLCIENNLNKKLLITIGQFLMGKCYHNKDKINNQSNKEGQAPPEF